MKVELQSKPSPDDFAGAMSRFSSNKKQPIAFMAFYVIS
jgi:hypothetical protein